MPSKPKYAIVTRQGTKWYVVFQLEVDGGVRCPFRIAPEQSVGVDFGLAPRQGQLLSRVA
jgi:hypothetical protein